MQVGGDWRGQGPSLILPLSLTDGAATLKLLNCLGLSLLTCEMGSQKPLHSIPGAELSHVGWYLVHSECVGVGGDVVLVPTALLGGRCPGGAATISSFWPHPGQGTQSWPLVLEGQSAGGRGAGNAPCSVRRG